MRTFLLAFAMLIFPAAALADPNAFFAGKPDYMLTPRHAFIVGVGNYQWLTPLTNPTNDAKAFYDQLKVLGFDSAVLSTADTDPQSTWRNSILDGLNDLRDQTRLDGGVLLFYFAGHGLSYNGETYLVPSDAHITDATDILTRAIPMSLIYDAITDAKPTVAIVIVDACRNNPFGRNPLPDGITLIPTSSQDPPYRTIVAFSTVLGNTADDGVDKNSPFTTALLQFMVLQGVSISEVFNDVRQTFDGPQVTKAPVVNDRLSGKFELMMTTSDFVYQQQKFNDADARGHSYDYQGFLGNYPGGYFEHVAQAKLAHTLQLEHIAATLRAVAPVQQNVVIANSSTLVVGDPNFASRSVTIHTGERLIATGEVGGYFQVLRNDGTRGFVRKSAVSLGAALFAGSSINIDAQTGNALAGDINSKIGAFMRTAPSEGIVTVQATLPANSPASKAPATLAATLETVKALTDAGVPASRIQVAPVVRTGTSASVNVLTTGAHSF